MDNKKNPPKNDGSTEDNKKTMYKNVIVSIPKRYQNGKSVESISAFINPDFTNEFAGEIQITTPNRTKDEQVVIDFYSEFLNTKDDKERKRIFLKLTEEQKKLAFHHFKTQYNSLIKGIEGIIKAFEIDESISNPDIEESKELEALKSVIPDNYYITNNKLANEMVKDFTNQGTISLAVIKPKKKGEIRTYNSLTYEGKNIEISGRREFNAYDRAVHNAVCSLYVAGNITFTPQMVYRTMTGMTETEKVNQQSIDEIMESIDKSRFTRLKVDFASEARARNLDVEKAEIDSNLLNAKVVTMTSGGREVSAFKILATPALYEYAQLTKQIISVPLELLDTREAVKNTMEIIPIREYLIRRIEIMKHSDMSNKITYDAMFNEVGIKEPTKQKSEKLRNSIKSVLELWKKKKYIKNFTEYKEGRSLKGVEITY